MQHLPARYIQRIGTVARLVIVWPDTASPCTRPGAYHRATREVARTTSGDTLQDVSLSQFLGKPEAAPTHCDSCHLPVPEVYHSDLSMVSQPLYNTHSGEPEPGDLFYVNLGCAERGERCVYGWTNCDGNHLTAILPNGEQWDTNARARNCTSPQDRQHRCWIVHGTPPKVHVDKNGHTCAAGAGSIDLHGWHGFLHDGVFRK